MTSRISSGAGDRDPARKDSYAQWVARAIALARSADRQVISLFESSVPEPKALLRSIRAATCATHDLTCGGENSLFPSRHPRGRTSAKKRERAITIHESHYH